MNKPQWIIIVLGLLCGPALMAAETFRQCMDNCPVGTNACTACCNRQAAAGLGAMEPCFDKCEAEQAGSTQRCFEACFAAIKMVNACPGEVPPQECEFKCQEWNSRVKKCVGPLRNNQCKCDFSCQKWDDTRQRCVGPRGNNHCRCSSCQKWDAATQRCVGPAEKDCN